MTTPEVLIAAGYVLGGIDRPRLRLDPDAGVSLVVSKLQEGRLNQPISSCQVPLR